MANRRMLQKSYSHSENLNDSSDFEKVLFMLAIPHLDDFGRICGNAKVFKALVLPMDSRDVEEYENALVNLESRRLILRYEVEGEKVIMYPKFEDEQIGLSKRTKSRYPDPPDDIKKIIPEVLRTYEPTEPNSTQENIKEPNLRGGEEVPYKDEDREINPQNLRINDIAKDLHLSNYQYLLRMAEEGDMDVVEKAFKEYENVSPNIGIKNPDLYFRSIVIRLKTAKYS